MANTLEDTYDLFNGNKILVNDSLNLCFIYFTKQFFKQLNN